MFLPKNSKYKKQQKGRSFNKITQTRSSNGLTFGSYSIKALEAGRVSSKQLESVYQSINKIIKKSGRIIMRSFPHTPITKKPIEIRMGKGKGSVDRWIAKITAGSLICEIECNSYSLVLKAFTLAKIRLPIKTKICTF